MPRRRRIRLIPRRARSASTSWDGRESTILVIVVTTLAALALL